MRGVVLLDMGGVLVDLGDGRGLPTDETDREGRYALARALEAAGGVLPADGSGENASTDESHTVGTAPRDRWEERWDAVLERWLFSPWRRGYRRRYARGAEEPWQPHLARLRSETGAELSDEGMLSAWFGAYGATIPAMAGAAETLLRLRWAGWRLGLVSNVPLPGVLYRRVLERYRLLASFDVLRFSHDAGVRKPKPGMLFQVLEELGVAPGEALMVGDRRDSDIAAGRAAGMTTIWLTGGRRGRGADDGPEPDLVVGTIADLPEALERRTA